MTRIASMIELLCQNCQSASSKETLKFINQKYQHSYQLYNYRIMSSGVQKRNSEKQKSFRRLSQSLQPFKQRLSNERDNGESIQFFLQSYPQLKASGVNQFTYAQRINIINLFTTAIPQFNQLYRKINDKIFNLFKFSTLHTYQRNSQLTHDGVFTSVFILLQGQVQLETEQSLNDQILRPIVLLGNNLLILNSKLIRVVCQNEENIFLEFPELHFSQFFNGVIQQSNLYEILEILRNAQWFMHLSMHQLTELCCAGKIIQCTTGSVIVRQGQPLNQSFFNKSTGQPFIYVTISGSFTVSLYQDQQLDEKKLDLFRYLHNEHLKCEVPLMQVKSVYSSSPAGQWKKNLIEVCEIQEGQLIGLQELMREETTRSWTVTARQANSKILEVDLSYIDGWKRFEDLLGLSFDEQLKNSLVHQIANRQKISETLEQTIHQQNDSQNEFIIMKKSQYYNRNKSNDAASQNSQNAYQVQLEDRSLENTVDNSNKIYHLNSNRFDKKQFINQKDIEDYLSYKHSIISRINSNARHGNKQKSLIEEFSEDNPGFLKLLRIKIFKETYSPHQNSIFYNIKQQKVITNNHGIYINRIRENSCADQSFLALNNYAIRQRKNQRKIQQEIQGRISQNTSSVSTPLTSSRPQTSACSAVRNTKRKLKSSRRSQLKTRATLQYDSTLQHLEGFNSTIQ